MKKIIAILVFLVMLLSVVGCTPMPEKTTATKTSAGTADAESENAAAADEESDDEGDSFADKFGDFVSMKKGMEFTVTYDQTVKSEGSTQKMVMTQYFGGPTKYRSDMTVQGFETRSYMIDKTFYACNKNTGSWQCLKIENQEQSTANFNDVEANPEDYDWKYAGTKTIAGAMTFCYDIKVEQAVLTECFTKEGIPLYMKVFGSGADMEMVAKSFKKSVSASDFTLPAKATDMYEMMAQYQQQMPEGYEQYADD